MTLAPLGLRRDLRPFDFTLLVLGGIVGDGIYVVTGLGAQHLGPAQLVAWGVAGVFAALIGLAFIQCAAIYPVVGGSYAYTQQAFGPVVGFLAGWALYLGEFVVLPVFPLAFVRYLGYFLPVQSGPASVVAKAGLVAVVTAVNLVGVRRGGRLNDVLTLTKLVPLTVIVAAAVAFVVAKPGAVHTNLTPFAPLGWGGFGTATVLIFWAYAGFELAVLPAGEVQNPRRTLPRGLLVGISAATLIYLLVALSVVIALPWQTAAASPRPLADALGALLSGAGLPAEWGPGFISAGALISIVGVCDVYMLSVARLSYALALDGSFPRPFAHLHPKYGTPWVGLVFQGVVAVATSLVFDISGVLGVAVFFLGLCFFVTGLAALKLVSRSPELALHVPALRAIFVLAAASGAYLAAQASATLMLSGGAALLFGLALYLFARRRKGTTADSRAQESPEAEELTGRR
jgi:APA family basic amino acid/polyamine antiporter